MEVLHPTLAAPANKLEQRLMVLGVERKGGEINRTLPVDLIEPVLEALAGRGSMQSSSRPQSRLRARLVGSALTICLSAE